VRVNKIDHICIAVKDLEAARRVWEPILGKVGPDVSYVDEIERLRVHRYLVGEVGFEIMESIQPGAEVDTFIASRGEGIFLIALNVDDTRAAAEELKQGDYHLVCEPRKAPTPPFDQCEYTFVHPRSANGVLLELIDTKWSV
jgi:methylmalonyl-CoA/ethylmalonyl-CoA epimerase